MRAFPFPDKEVSREELKNDLLYKKIPREDIESISDVAWDTGVLAAEAVIKKYGNTKSTEQIAKENNLIIERVNKDNVIGYVRYFSEYYSGLDKIVLYSKSIEQWSKKNQMCLKEAEDLILSHEYFHFLECKKIGLTSKKYTVPTIRIGPFSIGKSGIRALSEIGAHGFARTIFDLRGKYTNQTIYNKDLLKNEAINLTEFESKKRANEIYNYRMFRVFNLFGKEKES